MDHTEHPHRAKPRQEQSRRSGTAGTLDGEGALGGVADSSQPRSGPRVGPLQTPGMVKHRLAIGLIVALIAGCATSKDAPLAPEAAGPEFFVGTWTGSFEWREQAKTDPRPITVTITALTADGGVVGDLVYLALRSPGSRGQRFPLHMVFRDGRLEGTVLNWREVRLSRMGVDRLEGEAVSPTVGIVHGLRMEPIVIRLTRSK